MKRASDRALGLDTAGAIPRERLDLEGPHAEHASRYEPTPFLVFDDVLLELELAALRAGRPGLDRFAFVDLGAGKGRVVCLAAAAPFRAVIGVELSARLCRIARANVARLPPELGRRVRIVHRDAADFTPPPGPLVVFLFNPFDRVVLAKVLEKLSATPRELYVAYYMPVEDALLAASGLLVEESRFVDVILYRAREPGC